MHARVDQCLNLIADALEATRRGEMLRHDLRDVITINIADIRAIVAGSPEIDDAEARLRETVTVFVRARDDRHHPHIVRALAAYRSALKHARVSIEAKILRTT